MFWDSYESSAIDDILSADWTPDTLEKLMAEQDLIQETKSLNSRLIS